jgi:hypothetical protein
MVTSVIFRFVSPSFFTIGGWAALPPVVSTPVETTFILLLSIYVFIYFSIAPAEFFSSTAEYFSSVAEFSFLYSGKFLFSATAERLGVV